MPDIPNIAGCIQDGKGRLGRNRAAPSSTFKRLLSFPPYGFTSWRRGQGPTPGGCSSLSGAGRSGRREWPLLEAASPVVLLQGQQEPSHGLWLPSFGQNTRERPLANLCRHPSASHIPQKTHLTADTLRNVVSLRRKRSFTSRLGLYLAWAGLPINNEVLSLPSTNTEFLDQMLV